MTDQQFNYKEAIEALEGIVKSIEQGEPDVDELMDMVNRAAKLVKQCKSKLKSTEDSLGEALKSLEE